MRKQYYAAAGPQVAHQDQDGMHTNPHAQV